MRRPRSLTLTVHAILFVASATQTALVPLLPELARLHHLSAGASAFLISAPGLATLAVSAPAGVIAERFGTKRVTVLATALLAAGAFAQAIPSLGALVLGRVAFGLAYGTVWTTAVAWLAGAKRGENAGGLGAIATSSAAGMAAGPGIGGLLAGWLGLGAPFVVVGGLAAAATVTLAREPAPESTAAAAGAVRETAATAMRVPGVLAGAVALAVVGAIGGVTQLLVPLDLHRAGFSAATTGVAFSAAAVLYILVSGAVVKVGRRLTTAGAAAAAALALSVSVLPASVAAVPVVLIGVLVVSTVPRAMVSSVAYPLASRSAAEAALPDGPVIGMLNAAWALGLVLAPLIAGPLDGASPGAGYLVVVVPGALAALWLLSRGRARPRRLALAALRP